MKQSFLEAGKIVGTHGVRGMVRIQPWTDDNKFLCGFKRLFLDKSGTEITLDDIRPNGRIVIAKIKNVNTVEDAEKLRNKTVYIKREDAEIPDERYFISELIGCKVYNNANKEYIGKITDVSQTGANDVWHIEINGTEFLIPAIADVIVSVDINEETVFINVLEGLFDEN